MSSIMVPSSKRIINIARAWLRRYDCNVAEPKTKEQTPIEAYAAPAKKVVPIPRSEIQKREDLFRKQRSAKGGNRAR